jgi:hypothetical protein
VSVTDGEAVEVGAVERALEARLRDQGLFIVLGGGELRDALLDRHPDVFVARDAAPGSGLVLAVGLGEDTLAEARATAQELGIHTVAVAVDSGATGEPIRAATVRECVRKAGFVLAELERLLFRPGPGTPGDTRLERIDHETRLALARCVLADDPRAVGELADAIASLQRELDLQRQLELDHARTREMERVRAERLRGLEARLDDYGDRGLGAEIERLRAEIEAMRQTRVWRLGNRWWSFKSRFRHGSE